MTWLIGGNSNATTTSFLGTTNLQPLVIKTNNKEAMRVASADGDVSIGELGATRSPDYKLDVQGILNADDIYKDGAKLVGSQQRYRDLQEQRAAEGVAVDGCLRRHQLFNWRHPIPCHARRAHD
jgi:hypothetical protein